MSNTIQTSINWAQGYIGYLVPTVGTNGEPAVTAANMVQQIMQSPPFTFPWNRVTVQQAVTAGTQDYTISATNFGYLENCTLLNGTTNKYSPCDVKNTTVIGKSNDQQRPNVLSVQTSIPGTSITVRFLGVPDVNYTAYIDYQQFSPLMSSAASGWTVPDYMSYIYNRGFLAHLLEVKGDPRAGQEKMAFAAALLATHAGLTETERNLFLSQYLINPRMVEMMQLKTQQGIQARSA